MSLFPSPSEFAAHHFEISQGEHNHLADHFKRTVFEVLLAASDECHQVFLASDDECVGTHPANECRKRILEMTINLLAAKKGDGCG